ncbi:DUF4232 domain-containing protein [Streptomyces sp. NBC_01171]|uniref:DUF4232 domain-containing protein n=1 Tax=Streptomyces sp. NBC_01171 TaxID=2903757 RepID=UPI00386E181B|nr:DUF4232 domain-containing protein [Streptomyces sp. NBC_01171]
MTTQRARRTTRSAALAAATAALALGLTACGGSDDGSKAAGDDHTAGTSLSKGSGEGAGSTGGRGEGARSATVSNKDTTAAARQCRGDEMLVTAVHRFAGEQGDHLLVTASNEGNTPCWVTSYPAVKLGGDVDAATLPHSKKDNPGGDKHITLPPGGKAYSAVNLFDYGSKNHTAQSFAIALRGSDGHTGPFYSVDTKGEKPKFTWNEADVLNWNTEKPYDF